MGEKKKIHVLGISSSPRISGNTDLLIDQFLSGARENGAETEKIQLCDFNIKPCTQCDYCRREGNCIIRDDMQELYPKILTTNCLVLASPIYFMAHCAQAKLLIDRCQTFWVRSHVLHKPMSPWHILPRKGIFISVGATHGTKVFAGARVTMKWFFNSLEMEYWANLLIEGVDEKAAIRNHPTALTDAHDLGRKLAYSYSES